MSEISRRDFLNGVALTIASGLTPAAQLAAQPLRYPPALTGLRGHHPRLVRGRSRTARRRDVPIRPTPIEENYDLVVVGGGISGLAAAWFYRHAVGPDARILILDNHDDFGGHAKRNEFRLDGRLILGYGGSESLQSPKALYSKIAKFLSTSSASTSPASRRPSSAISIPRSVCRAACSSRARHSAATRW